MTPTTENVNKSGVTKASSVTVSERPKSADFDFAYFEDGLDWAIYRVEARKRKQYLLPKALFEILRALNGARTIVEVAEFLRTAIGLDVKANQARTVITRDLQSRGLVEANATPLQSLPTRSKFGGSWRNFDFAIRIQLASAQRIRMFVEPLRVFFRVYPAMFFVLAILPTHISLYREADWRPAPGLNGGPLAIA